MSEATKSSERVEVIDALRGGAALAVVLYHFVEFIPLRGIPVGPVGSAVVAVTRYGNLGVPVFFVLSGFVIAMTGSRYVFTPATGGRFVLRRLVRIAPPYWVMITLLTTAIVAGHVAGLYRNTVVTPAQVAAHFAYAQNLLGFPSLDVAYWTLCLEVQFYLVFAVSAVLLRSRGPAAQAGWFALLTTGSLVIDAIHAVPPAWFPCLWHQFGIGVLTYAAGRSQTGRISLAVLLGLILCRGQAAGVAVAVASLLLLLRRQTWVAASARPSFLLGLGRISYSLYLVHGFVGMALAVWFRAAATRSEAGSWAAIALATAVAMAFAWAFHLFCEQRAVAWSHRVRVGPVKKSAVVPTVEPLPNQPPQPAGTAAALTASDGVSRDSGG